MQFDGLGVFLSFISYPFYKDGKDLYNNIFKPFFSKHKEMIARYDPAVNGEEGRDPSVYSPAGYRLFGSNGLAILSLVDDYSFYNRFFNKNHIQSSLNNDRSGSDGLDLDFKSIVISGVYGHDGSDKPLKEIVDKTFLKKENRYRYIGIIRLKIDYRILIKPDCTKNDEGAIETIRKIKHRIHHLYDHQTHKQNLDYFIFDCYDNDELTGVAFSDKLITLFNFLGDIRSIQTQDLPLDYYQNGKLQEKHVFGSTYLCFGYDVAEGIGEDIQEDDKIICTIETRPGHRDTFYKHLDNISSELNIEKKSVIITGGCNIIFTMPLKKITRLEELCKTPNTEFRKNVKRIKVSLEDNYPSEYRSESGISDNHIAVSANDLPTITIRREYFSDVKELVKKVGISKMVRERLLALFELYNLSCQNLLQSIYLKELKPVLENIETVIKDMQSNPQENIATIERALNIEITNLENACYDRLHIQKSSQAPLEYSGGIQQYLTSFDFAYKQIYSIFSPNDKRASYVTITGAERASSIRSLFNLNIHDIIYPELFIVLVWKEIANFALETMKEYVRDEQSAPHKEIIEVFNTWHAFTTNKDSIRIIQTKIHQSEKLVHYDDISRNINEFISSELINYYIKDYIVFYYAFNGNFNLLWHFYFKMFLQTTSNYTRLNHVDKRHLIYLLLRIFMVAKLSVDDDSNSDLSKYLEKQKEHPFDYILSSAWMECYSKTLEATQEIYNVLAAYGFREMVDYTLEVYENNIWQRENPNVRYNPTKGESNQNIRGKMIETLCEKLSMGELVKGSIKQPINFLICLFGAFLHNVYCLDYYEKDPNNCPIKSVPRNKKGEILSIMENKEIFEKMIQIPVDTTGGFFIPSSSMRQQYFLLRTALYRSLWNYRFMFDINPQSNPL